MTSRRFHRAKVGASAAVVLATVVHATVAAEPARTFERVTSQDLSLAMGGSNSASVQRARVLFARKAVSAIQSVDRIASATPVTAPEAACPCFAAPPEVVQPLAISTETTYQRSAP